MLSIYYVENLSSLWISFKMAEPLLCNERLLELVSYLCHALLLVSQGCPLLIHVLRFYTFRTKLQARLAVEEDVGNFSKGENFRGNGSRQESERWGGQAENPQYWWRRGARCYTCHHSQLSWKRTTGKIILAARGHLAQK